ncbi:MAG: hypothetical protein AAGH41_02850 [Pseudomonadota bacterium]
MNLGLGLSLTSQGVVPEVTTVELVNTQIVVINGQSNTRRQDASDLGQTWASDTWEYTQAGALNQLSGSDDMDLYGGNDNPDGLEFARTFSVAFRAQHPSAKLVFVHGGQGGSGYADNKWNAGDSLFNNQVSRYIAAKAALETLGDTVDHYATIWGNGEKEARSSADDVRFAGQRHDAAITAFQTAIGEPTGAVLITPPGASGYTDDPDLVTLSEIWTDTPNRIANTAAISAHTDGPSGGPFTSRGDGLHHSAATMQAIGTRLHARRYHVSGSSSASVPNAPGGVSSVYSSANGDVTVTGTPGGSNGSVIFGYDVYRKLAVSSVWTKLNTDVLTTPSYVDASPPPGEDLDYALTAWNGKGEGPLGVAPTVSVPGVSATFPTSLLLHRYALADLSGTDSVGTNHLAHSGNTIVSDATFGNVVEVGSAGQALMPDTEPSFTGDWTALMWFKPSSTTAGVDRAAFGMRSNNRSNPDEIRFMLSYRANENTVSGSVVSNNFVQEMSAPIVQDAWAYVGITYDSGTGVSQLCLNGVAVASYNGPSGLVFNPSPTYQFSVGGYANGRTAENCCCRDLAIWNKVLTSAELSDAYVATS